MDNEASQTGYSTAHGHIRAQVGGLFKDRWTNSTDGDVFTAEQFSAELDLGESVVAVMYPPDFPMDAYFKRLEQLEHRNLWKPKGLCFDTKNQYITFERPNLTLEAYLVVREKHLYTPQGPCAGSTNSCKSSVPSIYINAARDFTSPMRAIIRGIVKGIAFLHRRDLFLGVMRLKKIFIVFENDEDIESKFPCVKLMMPEFQGDGWYTKSGKAPLSVKSDWKELGRFLKAIISKEGMTVSEHVEIQDLYDRLIQGNLTSASAILSHPALADFNTGKLTLLNFLDTMDTNTRYLGRTFQCFWVDHFQFILDDLPDGPKVRNNYGDGYMQFLYFNRNISCAHFGTLGSSLQATLIDDDTALRRLRGYYPRLFLELGEVDPMRPTYT